MVVWDGNVGDQRETYWCGWTSRDLQRNPGAQRGRWSVWDVGGGHGEVSGKPLSVPPSVGQRGWRLPGCCWSTGPQSGRGAGHGVRERGDMEWGRAGTHEAPVSVCPSVKLRRTSESLMAAVSLPAPNSHANSCLSHSGPEPCRRARWAIQFLV